MRRATQLGAFAHRAAAARYVPASTSSGGGDWVPVGGSGSPGQREGCGLGGSLSSFNPAAPAGGGAARAGGLAGPTFASSASSFATGATTGSAGAAASKAAPAPHATTNPLASPPPPPDVETVNALFIEAREELEYAAEDAGTTYAGESYEAAAAAVAAAGDAYAAFLAALPDAAARGAAQRGMGMKFEQLRAELESVEPGH